MFLFIRSFLIKEVFLKELSYGMIEKLILSYGVIEKLIPYRVLPRPPRQARQARFGPCLDFGFQYALKRNKPSKKI